MTPVRWVQRTQRRLVLLAIIRAAGIAGSIWYGIMTLAAAFGADGGLVPIVAAFGAFLLFLWRQRFVWSTPSVALWLEERIPQLRYALVTAIDPVHASKLRPQVDQLLQRIDPNIAVRGATSRTLWPIAAFMILLIGFNLLLTGGATPSFDRPGLAAPGASAPGNRLQTIRATVTPPEYAVTAGMASRTVMDPTTLEGLAGSRVQISGRGRADGITAHLGESSVVAKRGADSRWRIGFVMPDSAVMLRLVDGSYRRFVVIGPHRDHPPVAQLLLPARDTSMRTPSGSITLDTRLTDDIGVSTARFEYIISSGEGEGNFAAREGTLAARRFDLRSSTGRRERRLRAVVPLSDFALKPGDQLSVRAAVTDNNNWNGPSTGYSEPRILRIARQGEYDSLAVEAAPPPADSALMTLRYLIQLTERLNEARRDLPRQLFVDSSRGLGARAARLRFRVQQLQDERTMGRMFPPNPLLTTAYMALAQGEGALKVAEPREALPPLWEALRALQQYAWAERYYLRGRGGDVLVDLARVRLTGTVTGTARGRSPRSAADTSVARMRRSFATALQHLATRPERTRALLMELQVEALRTQPALAATLNDAITILQSGSDPGPALGKVRRLLEGKVAALDTLPLWSGPW